QPFMRFANHNGLCDSWILEQNPLKLGGVDIEASPDNHVFSAVHHMQTALFVELPYVARGKPSVSNGIPCRVGVVPVAFQGILGVEVNFPFLAGRGDRAPGCHQANPDMWRYFADGRTLSRRIRPLKSSHERSFRASITIKYPELHLPLEIIPRG